MAQATLSCPFGAIHLENRRGTAPMNTSPKAGVYSHLSPGPPIYGGRPPGYQVIGSGGQKLSGLPFLPPGHWARPGPKFERICAEMTPTPWAEPGQLGGCGCSPEVKKQERRTTSLPHKVSLTGAEAKRSFAGSSFAYFSFKKSRSRKRGDFRAGVVPGQDLIVGAPGLGHGVGPVLAHAHAVSIPGDGKGKVGPVPGHGEAG